MTHSKTQQGKIFAHLPDATAEEQFQDLLRRPGLRIERIVSRGQASDEDFWYDQDEGEWVMVLKGQARLELKGPDEIVELGPGDWVDLAPHRRHRVAWTDPDQDTVWLAVFYLAV